MSQSVNQSTDSLGAWDSISHRDRHEILGHHRLPTDEQSSMDMYIIRAVLLLVSKPDPRSRVSAFCPPHFVSAMMSVAVDWFLVWGALVGADISSRGGCWVRVPLPKKKAHIRAVIRPRFYGRHDWPIRSRGGHRKLHQQCRRWHRV